MTFTPSHRFLSYWSVDLSSTPAAEETQAARCRRLEMRVLAQVFLDATWEDVKPDLVGYNQKRAEALKARREARHWLLRADDEHRDHQRALCDNAGLPFPAFRAMVARFVIRRDDPAPLRAALSYLVG